MKKELRKQLKAMIKGIDILKECDRLANTGAIDLELIKEDDYSYSKVILKVALENLSQNLTIYSSEIRKEYTNLKRF